MSHFGTSRRQEDLRSDGDAHRRYGDDIGSSIFGMRPAQYAFYFGFYLLALSLNFPSYTRNRLLTILFSVDWGYKRKNDNLLQLCWLSGQHISLSPTSLSKCIEELRGFARSSRYDDPIFFLTDPIYAFVLESECRLPGR